MTDPSSLPVRRHITGLEPLGTRVTFLSLMSRRSHRWNMCIHFLKDRSSCGSWCMKKESKVEDGRSIGPLFWYLFCNQMWLTPHQRLKDPSCTPKLNRPENRPFGTFIPETFLDKTSPLGWENRNFWLEFGNYVIVLFCF